MNVTVWVFTVERDYEGIGFVSVHGSLEEAQVTAAPWLPKNTTRAWAGPYVEDGSYCFGVTGGAYIITPHEVTLDTSPSGE